MIYISYFYQIRFMDDNIIPLSTAMYDPRWFHEFKSQKHIFRDKNNVLNGVRFEPFVPNPNLKNLCNGQKECYLSNTTCDFLREYKEQIDSLDINNVMNIIKTSLRNNNMKEDSDVVFIVFETPNNPCSERYAIMDYFKKNNIEIKEWSKNLK